MVIAGRRFAPEGNRGPAIPPHYAQDIHTIAIPMPDKKEIDFIDLNEIRFEHDWKELLFRRAQLRILFVTDGRFSDTNSVYEYMDGQQIGCTQFQVDRALYSHFGGNYQHNQNPSPNEPHHTGFRFQSTKAGGGSVLDDYDVVFLFAVSSQGAFMPPEEVAELHRWMDAGGGIFATGDHATLGQRMGSHIPRVGTMRKWTTGDGVPPGTGECRLDTNQADPTHPGQVAGTAVVPGIVERDATPQPIRWEAMRTQRIGFSRVRRYPHEILCHPTLGPIDVMPDHPHEGECVEPSAIDLSAQVKYVQPPGGPKEYPSWKGHQERPRIIARGRNATQFMQAKGALKARTFPMISTYDGRKSGVGRVVVDSTWHHWYGMNIDGLSAAGGPNWHKIGRYFLNVAKYLAPAGVYRANCWWDLLQAQFEDPFLAEHTLLRNTESILELGKNLSAVLQLRWGPCSETNFVFTTICDLVPELCQLYEREVFPRKPSHPQCLSCPDFEVLRAVTLGGMARGLTPMREQLAGAFASGEKLRGTIRVDEIQELAYSGAKEALRDFKYQLRKDLEESIRCLQ